VDDRVREVALAKLRRPATGERLVRGGDELATPSGKPRYALRAGAIPLLADEMLLDAARRQREHYDALAPLDLTNLRAPHTEAYAGDLDAVLLDALGPGPLDDFPLWRWLRALIYRLSPTLDAETERSLRLRETAPPLLEAGLGLELWRPCALLGFCIFMNGDVLVVNRAFGRVPGVTALVRASARVDEWLLRLPGVSRAGLQVVGRARKGPGPWSPSRR
jgi:hypothetical protein